MEAPHLPPLNYPPDLPIVERREEIVSAIARHQVVVVTGETGSGKSTQLPKMCLEAGRGARGLIGCTQPRRIAAVTLARRVQQELGEAGARLVGWKIRFQDRTARATRVKFMTDGILLAEGQGDRFFRAYDTIIIDEAHERSLNIDFLIGILRGLLPKRPDLHIVVTSATIDPAKFSRAFGDAPMIEVSGRMYPVEVRYRPAVEDDDEDTHIERAVTAVEDLWRGGAREDTLVFMPTEADIRETAARLAEKKRLDALVLPLFGRMAASDQERVFESAGKPKIIISTNVAETSVTIPGIRYVVDTGLARLSRYNPRTRTRGLPVEAVSRASADQRKGRSGRVGPGICVRLYAEDDYLARPLFTPPEIQRANLAEVILRMLHLGLGDPEEFPFLDPPSPAAVKDGFGVLFELGAVDEKRHLTPTGRMMARLPLDPRLARMLIQAKAEGAVSEMLVIAAVLSIQDPRERPLEKEAQADQAHARFRDQRSDFTTLLKIWDTCSREVWREGGGGATFRKFCEASYLSRRRMREWRDVHEEVRDILSDLGDLAENPAPASFEAVHRAVVSGYLSHAALRKDKNTYQGTRGRRIFLFPGSGLFNRGGEWIVAAEVVQTSRLYARTVATIDPAWLEDLGKHLCRPSYSEPHWERAAGRVSAFERVTLLGLPVVERRKMDYGRVNRAEAREIFIRSALVEGDLPPRYAFLAHNREVMARIEDLESRVRRRNLLVDEETVFAFFDARIPDICDSRSLDRLIRTSGGDGFLRMTEADLLREAPDASALDQFPDTLALDSLALPLRYAFAPGTEEDGVTAVVPVHALPALAPEPFEWLVPGMIEEKVALLLKNLPKVIRRRLVPLSETAARVTARLPFREGSLFSRMNEALREIAGVAAETWDLSGLPPHSFMRFEVVGPKGEVLGAGRDLSALRALAAGRFEERLKADARRAFEREVTPADDLSTLHAEVDLGVDAFGVARRAWPGLSAEGDAVWVRLFPDPAVAAEATRSGLLALFGRAFAQELRHIKKSWIFPDPSAAFSLGGVKEATAALQGYILCELFDIRGPDLPDPRHFAEKASSLRGRVTQLAADLHAEVLSALTARRETEAAIARLAEAASRNPATRARIAEVARELSRLVPPDFLSRLSREHVLELPRYLRALRLRAERAYAAPEKDAKKTAELAPFTARLAELEAAPPECRTPETARFLDRYRALLEELRISLFAPEIGTRERASPKRLEDLWSSRPAPLCGGRGGER